MKWKKYLWGSWSWSRPFKSLGGIYLILAIVAYFGGAKLVFRPPPAGYSAQDLGIITVPAADGNQIACWWQPAADAQQAVIFYAHGNAEDLGDSAYLVEEWQARGYSVFAYDYPGYGISTGEPNESSVNHATQAAWSYLTQTLKIPENHIVIVGRSVGSGPAVEIASQHDPAGLVLISPFHSAFRAVTRYPIFLGDLFPNIDRISLITEPLLVIHGTEDRLIPVEQGKSLYDLSPSARKSFLPLYHAGHNDLFERYESEIFQAIDDWCPIPRGGS